MSWTIISETDVREALNDAELTRIREIVANGQADPLANIIAKATDYARGFVGKVVALDAPGLPPEVVNPVLDIIIYRVCKRVQTQSTEQRKPAADDAEKFLQGVAKGATVITDPDGNVVGGGVDGAGGRWGSRPQMMNGSHPDAAPDQ